MTDMRGYSPRPANLLAPEERAKAALPMDATEWRLWINAFLTFPEHGLLLL